MTGIDMEKLAPVLMGVQDLDALNASALACMAIDMAAKKSGMTPPEFMTEIMPIVESVYKERGFDGV